ncbi:MAG: Bug family tripartite tricarboxylate transporter substrate binding protein [Burkholderiaceae bacterium]
MNMKLSLVTTIVAAACAWAAPASAQRNTLTVLVGFPPGGATDVVARTLADKLKDALGQTVIVENRAGAGGQIATQQLKAAPADGSVVMLTIDHSHVIIPLTFKTAGYDPIKDFTPLAGVAMYRNALAVNTSLGATTMADFGKWLKANPSNANYGIPAVGSVPQFAGYILGQSLGTPMTSVPYKGGAPLVQDVLGQQVPAGIGSLTEFIDHHRAGKLRVLAVSGDTRSKIAPDIPTFQELGLKGIDKNPWLAFFGPRGLPPAFVERFNAAVRTALSQPDIVERLTKMGNEVAYTSPAELQEWVVSATQHWGAVIKASGFQPQ